MIKNEPENTMNLPLVTIGIPTYNRYDQLKVCMENVLAQTYPNLEILISDNTQEQNIPVWLMDLSRDDIRIRFKRQKKNLGAIGNHQYLIDHAKGNYFMFLHDDDEIPVNYVTVLKNHLIENPNVALIGPKCERYLEGKYWLTYENWDSRGKTTFERLHELIPDAFIYHWRFEQYIYGIFKLKGLKYKVSPTFKSQFHMFFLLSSKGELMNANEITLTKNTSQEELDKYKTNPMYKRYEILKLFNDNGVKSMQQCVPITLQMLKIIIISKRLSFKEKYKLIVQCLYLFVRYPIKDESIRFRRKYNFKRIKRMPNWLGKKLKKLISV